MLVVSMVTGQVVHTHYDSQYMSYDECKAALNKEKQIEILLLPEVRDHIEKGTVMTFICMPTQNWIDQRNMAIAQARSTETVI